MEETQKIQVRNFDKDERKGRIGVLPGTKRGPYKRTKDKREQKDIQEDGLSYQEIAAILGISTKEVKAIELRALEKLRQPTEANRILRGYHKE